MALTGDFPALRRFIDKIGGLAADSSGLASQIIDEAMGPIRELVANEFSTGANPYGEAWQPKKDGGQPFAGSDAAGRVTLNKVGSSIVRGSPAYPMHFHQEGTHSGGRRSQRKAKAAVLRNATSAFYHSELRAMAEEGGNVDKAAARKAARAAAKEGSAKKIAAALEELRATRSQRLPAREVVPTDDEGIPKPWEDALRAAATKIMANAYAKPTGGE